MELNAQTASIGANAFKNCGQIDRVLIPWAVKRNVEASGLPDQVPYVVYLYDEDAGTFDKLPYGGFCWGCWDYFIEKKTDR